MTRKLSTLSLLATLSVFLALPSCAHLQPVINSLPTVLSYVQDAELVLQGLETAETIFFAAKPNPTLQIKVDQGIALAKDALDAGLHATAGVTDLSQSQITQAFSAFTAAYTNVVALLGPLGEQHGAMGVAYKTTQGVITVRTPVLISGKW